MTTLAAPAPDRSSGSLALVRLLLRLHRPALTIWAVCVLALSAVLLYLGGPLTDAAAEAWRQYDACGFTPHCVYDQPAILLYKYVYTDTTFAVLAVPVLVAVWAGASLTGRELENGTARLAWTQGVSPARWLAAKLAAPAVAVAVGTGLLVLLHHLTWSAGQGRIDTAKSWYDASTFYANGPVVVALALAGLVLGALGGLLWRRSLAALGAAPLAVLLGWGGLHLVLPRLWPTATRIGGLAHGLPGTGITVGEGFVTSAGDRHPYVSVCGPNYYAGCRTAYDKLDAAGFYHVYHPAAHFWPLQLTASALVLTVTAVLALAAFRLLRRRTGGGALPN